MLVQRVLFQQFLVKAEPKEHHILIVEVLHHSRANAGVCDVVHQTAPVKFLGIEQFQRLLPVFLRDHQHPVLGGAGVAAVDGFRLPQQFAHTVGIDEAQFLIEQAADKVAVAVQHIVLELGGRKREVVFLRVQDFIYLVQKVY